MITYALAAKLFESFSTLRWNDWLRPVEMFEIDHHALKSMLTYFLGKTAEYSSSVEHSVDWVKIVDVNVFDLLSKISTSDIHSNVRKRLKRENEQAFTEFIFKDWSKPSLNVHKSILDSLASYLDASEKKTMEYSILRFAHKYITSREYKIIEKYSLPNRDNTQVNKEISEDVVSAIHESFREVAESIRSDEPNGIPSIMGIVERLRYQTRWSQTPRIPQTSVLGHSMYCAVLAYFISIEAGLSNERIVNNFYAALFHDLPEALSRDIIAPVKKAHEEINRLITKIEKELCEEQIISQIPEMWRSHFRFITGQLCPSGEELHPDLLETKKITTEEMYDDFIAQQNEFHKRGEFANRIQVSDNKYIIVPWDDVGASGYQDPMDAYKNRPGIDGKLLKICDNIAAFMEARMSIQYGIRSPQLDNGISSSINACRGKRIYNLVIDDFFDSITF